MTLQEITKKLQEIKNGKFIKIHYVSEKNINGDIYTKDTKSVVRFVKYANIKGVMVKGKINPNEITIVPNTLYANTNTGNTLLQVATSEVKPHVSYYRNGNEINKVEFENTIKSRTNGEKPVVFRININNIIAIGE